MLMKNKNFLFTYIALFFLVVLAFLISIFFGALNTNLFQTMTSKLATTIIFKLRLPRSILVLLAGALLSASGSMFQMYFRNPLAEPGLMGMSSGATLGALVLSIFFPYNIWHGISIVSVGAFLGALLSGVLIMLIAAKSRANTSSSTIILCGTALGTFYSAITSILELTHEKDLHKIYVWLMGSFSGKSFLDVKVLLVPSLISFVLLFVASSFLDLLCGGEESAIGLGLNVHHIRILVLFAGALASSCAVCAGGTISFVGLVAPHIVRRIWTSKGKHLFFLSMLLGASLLLISDTIARTVVRPSELPVGIITSIIGVPFFISLIFTRSNYE